MNTSDKLSTFEPDHFLGQGHFVCIRLQRTVGSVVVNAPPAQIVADVEAPTGDTSATPPSVLPVATTWLGVHPLCSNDTTAPAIDENTLPVTLNWQIFPSAWNPE